MKRAEEILIELFKINPDKAGEDYIDANYSDVIEAMKQYAEEMVKHNLKIAAENAELDIDYRFDGEDERKNCFEVDKYSITCIKIELL